MLAVLLLYRVWPLPPYWVPLDALLITPASWGDAGLTTDTDGELFWVRFPRDRATRTDWKTSHHLLKLVWWSVKPKGIERELINVFNSIIKK